jgi:hypothetical protein
MILTLDISLSMLSPMHYDGLLSDDRTSEWPIQHWHLLHTAFFCSKRMVAGFSHEAPYIRIYSSWLVFGVWATSCYIPLDWHQPWQVKTFLHRE